MAVRFDKKFNQEINRAIRNFNAKVSRLENSGRTDAIIPDRINREMVLEDALTRREIRRRLNYLRMFSKRNSEKAVTNDSGLRISKYELEVTKREARRIKANLTRQINKRMQEKPSVFGQEEPFTFGQLEDSTLTNLKATRNALNKDISSLNVESFKRFKELLKRRDQTTAKDERFKDNYLEMLLTAGYFSGFDEEKLTEIHDKIKNLSTRDFLNLFNNESAIKSILEDYNIYKMNFEESSYMNEDVRELYSNLYDNLDRILRNYS